MASSREALKQWEKTVQAVALVIMLIVELVAISKVVLTLVLVAKVLVRVSVGTGKGCVCGDKCWMVVVSSMAVMTKQELAVALVEALSSGGGSDSIGVVRWCWYGCQR